jgi:hypothetical protein
MPATYTKVLAADAARDTVSWQPMPTSGDLTAEYILGAADATLPNSLVLTAGSGVTLTPGGGLMTVAASGPPNLFPYVDTLGTGNYLAAATSDGPGFTLSVAGVSFTPWVVGSVITGMRFVWVTPGTGALDVQCDLWGHASSAVPVASATVSAPTTGIITATFSSPYTVTVGDLGATSMVLSVYAPYPSATSPTGAYYCAVDEADLVFPAIPILASPLWRYVANTSGGTQTTGGVFGLSGTATGSPTPSPVRPSSAFGLSAYFAMEPVFA